MFAASVSHASPYMERTVKFGETLYSILGGIFDSAQVAEIVKEIKSQLPDFTLKAGATLLTDENSVLFKLSLDKELLIEKDGDGFRVEAVKYPVETVTAYVTGNIESSLYGAITSAGEDFSLAMKLAEIFEWEIDFFKGIRTGDSFTLLVDKRFIKGEFAGYGKVHAADFFNNGRHIRALYYENGKTRGYFTPEGDSLRKGFLKAPLKFSRISSTFSYKRLHPVLNKVRPHLGVDYAAPVGTPIHATADGYISKKGYGKYNGNFIGIRHTNDYHTLFLHMSRFAKGMGIGKYVRQGEVIGYVGSTGISTGPHLDYRIRKGSTYINPLTFKAPASKLPKVEVAEFQDATKYYASRLDEVLVKTAYASKTVPTM
ncbi:M23 family peptidase [Geovibrio thiophilus]|uniref:M23 family peptidase n=2 Tax=Geovibrio thiophilus TaxID=139438 RepID=A0A3R5UZU6_9BACT|nr:M23 family peptidase [Geovibrio thiophilus]